MTIADEERSLAAVLAACAALKRRLRDPPSDDARPPGEVAVRIAVMTAWCAEECVRLVRARGEALSPREERRAARALLDRVAVAALTAIAAREAPNAPPNDDDA